MSFIVGAATIVGGMFAFVTCLAAMVWAWKEGVIQTLVFIAAIVLGIYTFVVEAQTVGDWIMSKLA